MSLIDINEFVAFCKKFEGQTLTTIGGKSKFILESVTDKAFYYTVSTDKSRKQDIRYVKRILERYAKINSLNPGHYANITMNASYVLALVKIFADSRPPQTKVDEK